VIRGVHIIYSFNENLALLEAKVSPIQDPVNMACSRLSCEAMEGAGIGHRKGLTEIQAPFAINLFAREPAITRAFRRGVEIAHQNSGRVVPIGTKLFLDNTGSAHLGRRVKIKMGVDTDQRAAVNVKQPQCALPRETASKRAAWDMGCFAQKEMSHLIAHNRFAIKENIVLPELRRRNTPSYVLVIAQALGQKINLEIIGFLRGNEIRVLALKKLDDALFAKLPRIRPVVGKAKT